FSFPRPVTCLFCVSVTVALRSTRSTSTLSVGGAWVLEEPGGEFSILLCPKASIAHSRPTKGAALLALVITPLLLCDRIGLSAHAKETARGVPEHSTDVSEDV